MEEELQIAEVEAKETESGSRCSEVKTFTLWKRNTKAQRDRQAIDSPGRKDLGLKGRTNCMSGRRRRGRLSWVLKDEHKC